MLRKRTHLYNKLIRVFSVDIVQLMPWLVLDSARLFRFSWRYFNWGVWISQWLRCILVLLYSKPSEKSNKWRLQWDEVGSFGNLSYFSGCLFRFARTSVIYLPAASHKLNSGKRLIRQNWWNDWNAGITISTSGSHSTRRSSRYGVWIIK